jgi:type VI secretion system secreted protein VgrG
VQYDETDYDFLSRLMEEEGIYHFWDNAPGKGQVNKLIICDDKTGSHTETPDLPRIKYTGSGGAGYEVEATVTDWTSSENVISGKVTINDFDMLVPTASQKKVIETITESSHSHKNYELYRNPVNYRKDNARGDRLGEVLMQAVEVDHKIRRGATTTRNLSTGYKFTLDEAPEGDDGSYLVIGATHYIRPSTSHRQDPNRLIRDQENIQYPEEMESMDYVCYFRALAESVQFRSKRRTPWPRISGVQSALVVGPSGEEIYTDEHGRIRIQFPWDLDGQNNENSTCWVRVATPWSGNGWGMVAIPRIGQEVIIQFEEGNPDRPVCTGMLWNEEKKPAFDYPTDATQLGIRTNSSKGGGGYNELMFEDKAGDEMMRVQAQKDHQFLIKNKSVVTIGLDEIDAGDHDEDGSLSEVIRNHVTRSIQEGNHYFTIEAGDEEIIIDQGNQTIEIEGDKTETIRTGNHVHTVETGNMETTVATGDHVTTIDSGNMMTTVSSGNHETTVSSGDIEAKATAGNIKIEAGTSIELKVGSNSIKIEQSGITIKGIMVNIEGTASAEMKGKLTTVKADTILTVKGATTMIN